MQPCFLHYEGMVHDCQITEQGDDLWDKHGTKTLTHMLLLHVKLCLLI